MKRWLALLMLVCCQSADAQLPNRVLNSERRLPTSFYAALTDGSAEVKQQRGNYNLDNGLIGAYVSNKVIDLGGSTIRLNPASAIGSNYTPIIVGSPILDLNVGSPARAYAHLTGTITPSTTTVTWVDGALPSVGDEIEVNFGVNITDPAEYSHYFLMTVATVVGDQVTFTSTFGQTVPFYADVAALKAATDPSNYSKIDDGSSNAWDGAGNHKGLGHDGIAYRFQAGRMTHDVTIKNFRLKVDIPSGLGSYPEGSYLLFIYHGKNVTFENFAVENAVGSVIHETSSFGTIVQDFEVTGRGSAKAGGSGLAAANFRDTWGAVNNIARRGVFYNTTNINGFVSEIYLNGTTYNQITFSNIVADPAALDQDQFYFFQHACVTGQAPTADNILAWITGTTDATFIADHGTATTFGSIGFTGGDYFPVGFNFATRTVGTFDTSVTHYGAMVSEVKQLTVPANNGGARHVYPPAGFYKKLRIRSTDPGSFTGITDGYGNSYAGALTPNNWVDVTAFAQMQPGPTGQGTLRSYHDNCHFDMPCTGNGAAAMELDVEYWPITGADWSVQ